MADIMATPTRVIVAVLAVAVVLLVAVWVFDSNSSPPGINPIKYSVQSFSWTTEGELQIGLGSSAAVPPTYQDGQAVFTVTGDTTATIIGTGTATEVPGFNWKGKYTITATTTTTTGWSDNVITIGKKPLPHGYTATLSYALPENSVSVTLYQPAK